MTESIQIGKQRIGPGSACFIAAEVGINHNGSLELALESIRAAAEAGADAVKFQNYRTADFIADCSLTYTYRSQGREITETQWDMFRRCELKPEWLPQLKRACDEAGVVFFSTATGEDGIRELVEIGAPLLKNGSDFLTHTPLLEQMGATGLPVVISTGMADERDIEEGVAAVRRGGGSDIILLHCTSAYPTPPAQTNLRRMNALRERFGTPVGFSDHTEGAAAAVQAVSLGACFLEKHLTLDHNLPGPDHWFSSTPQEFRELVEQVRTAEQRLGVSALVPAASEVVGREQFRISAVAARDIASGEKLTPNMVAFRRPGGGLRPAELDSYYGRKIARAVRAGEPLDESAFARSTAGKP